MTCPVPCTALVSSCPVHDAVVLVTRSHLGDVRGVSECRSGSLARPSGTPGELFSLVAAGGSQRISCGRDRLACAKTVRPGTRSLIFLHRWLSLSAALAVHRNNFLCKNKTEILTQSRANLTLENCYGKCAKDSKCQLSASGL